MAAIVAVMMDLYPGLHCRRLGVVVTAERHLDRG
jgi:hypothetical protein